MNKDTSSEQDEMRPEYDLTALRVRRVGPGRTQLGGLLIALEPDVAARFPDAEAVNTAPRFLIKQTEENPLLKPVAGATTWIRKS